MFRHLLLMGSLGLLLVASTRAQGGGPAADSLQKGGAAAVQKDSLQHSPVQHDAVQKGSYGPQYVEKTICVPQVVTEMRTITVTQYRQEQRQVMDTVYRCEPVQQEVQRSCVIRVPEIRTKTIQYPVYTPVMKEVVQEYMVPVPQWRDVERQYTVMVPTVETRQGVRRVCTMVPEEIVRTVCVDRGHWETRAVEVPCAHRCRLHRGCGNPGCVPTTTICQNVWVPNPVQEQVSCTVMRPQWTEVPCEYQVTVCKPEVRSCMVRVCETTMEPRTCTRQVCTYETTMCQREVQCTVMVPQVNTWTEVVTSYRRVPEQVPRMVTVCVPEHVQRQIPVTVCTMVTKTIQVPVCPPPCGGCGRCRRCGC